MKEGVVHEDSLVTLLYGDGRKLLPSLIGDRPWALVTDPPYGIDHASGQEGALKGKGIQGDDDVSLREWWVTYAREHGNVPAIVFGSWKRPEPPGTRHALVWDKGMGVGMGDLTLPWKPNWEEIYVIGEGFLGHRGSSVLSGYTMVSWVSRGREHPNQKPVSLMEHLLEKVEPDRLIVDPFAGSAATLAAAKRLGRPAIGAEIDTEWIPGAVKELAKETLASQTAAVAEQEALL